MTDRPTALVTGASSGIGEELARLLAAKGNDLVLVARGRSELEKLAKELETDHRVSSEVLVADLQSRAGIDAVCDRIASGKRVDIVVNNAGFGWYGEFAQQPEDEVWAMTTLNALAVAAISRAALGNMVPNRAGKLLNVASTAAFVPGPRGAVYHATKAFVLSLTEALHEETLGTGVHVTALCPGVTPTAFQARAEVNTGRVPSFMLTEASFVAKEGLAALERNQAVCIPGIANKVLAGTIRLGPRVALRKGSRKFLSQL